MCWKIEADSFIGASPGFAMLLLLLVVMQAQALNQRIGVSFYWQRWHGFIFLYRANPYLQRIYKWSHE